MPHIDKHAPGTFCWIELATTDQNAGKQFYSNLFGWEIAEFPMGPSEVYTMFKLHGDDAAAAYTQRADERTMVPPHWNLYICVSSADESAKRAGELGGTVVAGPFDVMTFGRMAVIMDPTGAAFCIWEPKSSVGTTVTGEPGTLCWADLSTRDVDGAKKFYESLFGWKIAVGEHDSSGYLHIKSGEEFIGGMPPAEHQNPKVPPHWMIYFFVSDVDATTAKAKELGAAVHMPPMTIENVGRMSVVADQQGAAFAVFQPMPRS